MQLDRLPGLIRGAGPAALFPVYSAAHAVLSLAGLASRVGGTNINAFWPAGGLLLAACIICRRRQRWTLLAAAVTGEVVAYGIDGAVTGRGLGPWRTLYVAIGHAATYGLSAALVERWWQVPLPAGLPKLARGTGVVSLVMLAGVAAVLAGSAGSSGLPVLTLLPTALASHVLGAVAVTPLILAWWMSLIGYKGEATGSAAEFVLLSSSAAVATYVLFAGQVDIPLQPAYVFFPILLWAAMRFPPRHVSVIGLAITIGTVTLTSAARGPAVADLEQALSELLSLQLYLMTILISALWVGVANYERRRSEDSLRRYAQALTTADERVRRSTAVDLHDGISQEIFGLGMLLSAARKKTTDPEAEKALAKGVAVLGSIGDRTRQLIQEIDPPWVYQMDLCGMVGWLAERFRDRAGLRVELRDSGVPSAVPGQDRAVLFRCIRELLQNVVRHSGTKLATVELGAVEGALCVTVADAGRDFDTRFAVPGHLQGGFGLFSVREQLAARGAQMSFQTAPGHGCAVTIVWPFPARESAQDGGEAGRAEGEKNGSV